MFSRWYDIDRDMATLEELQRRMEGVFGNFWGNKPRQTVSTMLSESWPAANLYDSGTSLVAMFQVPGLSEKDLKVEVQGDVLSISGERKNTAPEGYHVHRSERGSRKFSRSFGLPCQINSEKTTAKLKNGVLTISMEKHEGARPKQINISAQ